MKLKAVFIFPSISICRCITN